MKKNSIIAIFLSSLLVFSFVFISSFNTFAQGSGGNNGSSGTGSNGSGGIIQNPLKSGVNNFYDLVKLIINNIVIPFGSVVIVLMIIFAGFQFVVAQGNEQKITDAKQTLLYAVIGAVILLGSWAIAGIIENTINQVTGKDLIG